MAWTDGSGVGGTSASGTCAAVGGAEWEQAAEVLPVVADGVRIATVGPEAAVDVEQ